MMGDIRDALSRNSTQDPTFTFLLLLPENINVQKS